MSSLYESPWKLRSSQLVYDNPWIRLEHQEVITPTGSEGIYGKVHFKNLALAIIPLDEEMNTWIVGQHRHTLNEYSWELPMGGGAFDVEPVVSAQRELKEETGLEASDWSMLMKLHTSNSVTDEVAYVYVARGLTMTKAEFDPTEKIDIRKLPFRDLFEMVIRGEITDAISVAGILKLEHQLGLS